MKKRLCFFVIYSLLYCIAQSAPIINYPFKLMQPDSTILNCFLSGDEYFNWVHNLRGNIIKQDANTGFYIVTDDSVSSIDSISTQSLNCLNFKDIIERDSYSNSNIFHQINNIVIFIRFSDQNDYTQAEMSYLQNIFNDTINENSSLKSYYKYSSRNKLNVSSYFFPNNTLEFSYQDSFPRAYFCPYSSSNPIGYLPNDNYRKLREDSLIVRAITAVQNQIPYDLNLDTNEDHLVDNISFVIQGDVGPWNVLLWPHKWQLNRTIYINNVRVYFYNFLIHNYLKTNGIGTICHEFAHTLGAPDLYHARSDSLNIIRKPVGDWDLMATTKTVPQQISAYVQYKYLHWIDSLPTINMSGTYSIKMLTDTTTDYPCYKIPIYNSDEFLMLEYRNNLNEYDILLPNSGLLIYRINPNKHGNYNATEAGGLNDEIYVYRPYGTFSSDGNIYNANFAAEDNRVMFSRDTNPFFFLSNGSLGDIYIENISNCEDSISFDVRFCEDIHVIYDSASIIPINTHAKSVLIENNDVDTNQEVNIEVNNSAVLKSNFEVKLGGTLNISIQSCDTQQ